MFYWKKKLQFYIIIYELSTNRKTITYIIKKKNMSEKSIRNIQRQTNYRKIAKCTSIFFHLVYRKNV